MEKAEELAAEQENTVPLWKKELRRLSRGNSRGTLGLLGDSEHCFCSDICAQPKA